MGSSRFPGKVLREICGFPMVGWVARRSGQAALVDQVVVATTSSAQDNPVEEFCHQAGIACFRGNEFDVLDRYYQAALDQRADIVVRLTADCPLIDPWLIDAAVEALVSEGLDFSANRLPPPYRRTYPIGLDVEAVTFRALEMAWRNAKELYEREHVMPYLYNPDNGFKFRVLEAGRDLGHYRWTVDTPEDYQFITKVMERMECREDISWLDIVHLLESEPGLMEINAGIRHKTMCDVDERAEPD
jgi:spore coat polysaccharide biosynthesis protein SpsF